MNTLLRRCFLLRTVRNQPLRGGTRQQTRGPSLLIFLLKRQRPPHARFGGRRRQTNQIIRLVEANTTEASVQQSSSLYQKHRQRRNTVPLPLRRLKWLLPNTPQEKLATEKKVQVLPSGATNATQISLWRTLASGDPTVPKKLSDVG